MAQRKIIRQGDVILESIEDIDIVKYAEFAGNRLEVRSETGNPHTLNDVKVYRYSGQVIVAVEKPTYLTHPQHPPVLITPGVYRLRYVRDWLLENQRPID